MKDWDNEDTAELLYDEPVTVCSTYGHQLDEHGTCVECHQQPLVYK